MRYITVLTLRAFALHARADAWTNHTGGVQRSFNSLADKLVDKFWDQALRTSPPYHAREGCTMLGNPIHSAIIPCIVPKPPLSPRVSITSARTPCSRARAYGPGLVASHSRKQRLRMAMKSWRDGVGVAALEPTLQDFTVPGAPTIVSASYPDDEKPVLLYLPGIELSGYALHRQIPKLAVDFEVRYLATSPHDRTEFHRLAEKVRECIETEYNATGRHTYLVGESFGGVLALAVALNGTALPNGLAALALVNPATSITRSWSTSLQPLIDAISVLPPGLSDATYSMLATPILAYISVNDPLQLGGRFEDDALPRPLRLGAALNRLAGSLPVLIDLPSALPLSTIAFRLPMLLHAAKDIQKMDLSRLTLPVQVLASSEDRVLPSVSEGERLVRGLPNAQLTVLSKSGHAPLLEVQVRLADLLRQAHLTERGQVRTKARL